MERYRPLLRVQARVVLLRLDPRLRRRFDSSDLVHDTLVSAYEKRDQFRGNPGPELENWLREILVHTAIDKVREHRAQKRDVALERSLQDQAAQSSARIVEILAPTSSPSQQAEREEMKLRLAAALEQLPEEQRNVIIHRYLLGSQTPVAQIAEQMGCTPKAVAGLLYRAKHRLRELLEEDQ